MRRPRSVRGALPADTAPWPRSFIRTLSSGRNLNRLSGERNHLRMERTRRAVVTGPSCIYPGRSTMRLGISVGGLIVLLIILWLLFGR